MKRHVFHPTVLREYDVRGVVGDTLHCADAYALGRSFAVMVREAGLAEGKIAVCRDGRLSSAMLEDALVDGLTAGGLDVVQIGMGPTPMLYFAEASSQQLVGGIQVTGSHNPKDHNGFKIVLGGRPVFGKALVRLGQIAASGAFERGKAVGRREVQDILHPWVEAVAGRLSAGVRDILRDMRIGWDTGNGAAGPAIELLADCLPGDHHLLFTSVDGTFPNHHPDPSEAENLADLQALVAAKNLHFGCAFDGDADRLGIVDGRGRSIDGDRMLAMFAMDVLKRRPGATVVADIKCSSILEDIVLSAGGRIDMWKSGHSHIKSRMNAIGAQLGGENTGHVFLTENWYGFDDGVCAAAEMIAVQARLGRTVDDLADSLPATFSTPEMRVPVAAEDKFTIVNDVRAHLDAIGVDYLAIDGVRVRGLHGWWLLRASNTQEMLSIRAESATREGLDVVLREVTDCLSRFGVRLPPA